MTETHITSRTNKSLKTKRAKALMKYIISKPQSAVDIEKQQRAGMSRGTVKSTLSYMTGQKMIRVSKSFDGYLVYSTH